MPNVVETWSLTKYYGSRMGIEDLTLDIREGETFGFLGPNGAGKTTTIRLLLDHIRPTRGHAAVFGLDPRHDGTEIRSQLGYIPGDIPSNMSVTGHEILRAAEGLRAGSVDWRYVYQIAERLESELTVQVRKLSRGNRQKIAIISAIMHKPRLLIADEPTGGLDPLMQQEFNAIIRESSGDGMSIFLSSHILSEVEHLCDRVGMIRGGTLMEVAEVSELKHRSSKSIEIRFAENVGAREIGEIEGFRLLESGPGFVRGTVTGSLDRLIKSISRFEILDLVTDEPSLEDIVLSFYGPEHGATEGQK